jgi:DNA repair photolyase
MMFGWSLNPYMGCAHQCTFCYVRAFEKRADRPSDDRYGASIRVKTNVADVLRRELARRSWKGELVAIGAATDPYQPAEGFYRLTRGCLQVLAEAANPLSIITRGPMVVRDVDVLVEAAARARVSVTFSVPTLDDKVWRLTEPNTPPPRQRLRALETLRAAGIDASVGMAPILPGLSDRPELMAEVVKAARDAGATSIWTNVLYLRPGTREHFLACLARDWPELVPMYDRLYEGRAYLGKAEVEPVRREVAELRNRFAVPEPVRVARPPGAIDGRAAGEHELSHRRVGRRTGGPATEQRRRAPVRTGEPQQLELSLAVPSRQAAILHADAATAPTHRAPRRAPLPSRRGSHAGDHVGHRPFPGHQAPDEGLLGVP